MNGTTVAARRSYVRIPLAIASVLVAAACGSTQSATSGAPSSGAAPVVRGVGGNTSDPIWTTIMCGATKEAKARGLDFKWYAGKTADTTEMTTNLNAAMLDSPRGLILNAINAGQFAAKTQQLMDQGIPIVTAQEMTPPTQLTAVQPEQTAPAELVTAATDAVGSGGSVLVLGGAAGVDILKKRYQPLVDGLKARRGVTVLDVQYTDFDPTKAQSAVSSALLAQPDLKLVIASTGPESQGVVAAVQRSGRKDIKVIAFDAVPAVVAALKNGMVTAIGSQPAAEIGRRQVQALSEYLTAHPDGGPVQPGPTTPLQMGVLTTDNVDDPAMAPFIYSATCDD